ncbi:hypothetical protein VNO78_02398 [Psophocarpus tetragonolobus]|uniref:Ubiquitin-like protease family profile domain-containing protein n=1 Tax=Psophocarpus tetragonolobus TaxID=3891 RepID=A0AAN9XVM5_PSOTE
MLVYSRQRKRLKIESSSSRVQFDWSNVPRRLRTKKKSKFNDKELLSKTKEKLCEVKEMLSNLREELFAPKEVLSRAKKSEEALPKPKEALSRPKKLHCRPKAALSRLKEAPSRHQETLFTPNETLFRPNEALSTPRKQLCRPKEALSTSKEVLSKPKETLLRSKEALSTPKKILLKPKEALPGSKGALSTLKEVLSRPKEKLDSGVFDIYLKKIWKIFSEDRKRHFTCFDSLWFSLYRTNSSKDKVLTWIKKEPIFSKAYVFVPIVCWGHWSLLILCHFGENLQSTTRSRCMLLLDSLEIANPRRLEPEIRRFVLDIYKIGSRPETKHAVSQIPFLVPKVPQQRDGNECGFFSLYFINLFLELAPDNFSMEEYPYFMKKDWFTFEDLDRFYEKLDSLN